MAIAVLKIKIHKNVLRVFNIRTQDPAYNGAH
jgi:hypothetical protein